MSVGEKFGLFFSLAMGLALMAAGGLYCWKKKVAITRVQRLRKLNAMESSPFVIDNYVHTILELTNSSPFLFHC